MSALLGPVSTVDHVLTKSSEKILSDVNEYLHPATPRWYSNRGIPYRRGYLLYGPPGTGKSSLAWALAGVFGLDIYVISLADPQLDESDLANLFTSLPRRCFVLLEDIDSAGLSRREEPDHTSEAKEGTEAFKIGVEISKAFQSVKKSNEKEKQGISLSGLLNSIDGVASHEGRVLIMTTNHLEKLDEALIRPGRIDLKVPFTNATTTQIRELFLRMYTEETPHSTAKGGIEKAAESDTVHKGSTKLKELLSWNEKGAVRTKPDLSALTPPATPTQAGTRAAPTATPEIGSEPALHEIAAEFAAKIPELAFTPAEIQGYLLTHKREPSEALAKAEEFRDQLLAAKAKKKAASEQRNVGNEQQ